MKRPPYRSFLLVVLLVSFVGASAWGQRPSHEFGDPSDGMQPKNLKKLLDERRGKNLLANLDNQMLRNLIKNLPRNIDPKQFDDDTIEKLLQDNPDLRDPKNLERLKNLVQDQQGERPNPNDERIRQNVQEALNRVDQFQKNNQVQPVDPIGPKVQPVGPMANRPPPRERPNPAQQPKNQDTQAQDFAKFLAKNFGDSPEIRDMAKDFARLLGQSGIGDDGTRFLSELGNQWKSFTGSDDFGRGLSGGNALKDFAAGLKPPDLNFSGSGGGSGKPSTNSGGGWLSSSNSSSSSSGTGGGLNGGSWAGPMVIALFVLAGIYIWLRRAQNNPDADAEDAVGKRAWPVNPDGVATREDVVKAFDFLSIAKCGDEAINWHHRQIADRLGANVPDQRAAADELAGLYEKARYTPANEPFSETDIAEARARLCKIAGAPTV